MHHQYHQPPIKTFGRECLCFLQPIRIQMQYEPDGRNGLPRHSNPFTDLFRSTGSGQGHLYLYVEQRLVHLFRKLETKKTRTHRRYHCNHITRQQRGYMAGTRRNRNLPLQQKQTDLYMVAQG